MPSGTETIIRKFGLKDREAVRSITFDTAFMGEPAAAFFSGRVIFCDALTLYFTDYEPHSCFVAENNHEVIGCLLGAKDKAAAERFIAREINPGLFLRAAAGGVFLKKKNLVFIFKALSSMIKGEFKMPDFSAAYPATLHINIKQGYRGLRVGSRLMDAYLAYLREEGVAGVHLATFSEDAGKFFLRQGFALLHTGRRSYFNHLLHKDTPVYIYGKKLS